jgi:hypothetical protein
MGELTVPRPAGRRPRFSALLHATTGLALLVVAAGCSSGPSAATLAQRRADAAPLLAECVLEENLLAGPAEESLSPTRTPWLRDGGVLITPSDAPAFNAWYRSVAGDKVRGESLTAWQQWSALNDRLPAALCGSDGAAPGAMQKQVYADDPAAGDPWGS